MAFNLFLFWLLIYFYYKHYKYNNIVSISDKQIKYFRGDGDYDGYYYDWNNYPLIYNNRGYGDSCVSDL